MTLESLHALISLHFEGWNYDMFFGIDRNVSDSRLITD